MVNNNWHVFNVFSINIYNYNKGLGQLCWLSDLCAAGAEAVESECSIFRSFSRLALPIRSTDREAVLY